MLAPPATPATPAPPAASDRLTAPVSTAGDSVQTALQAATRAARTGHYQDAVRLLTPHARRGDPLAAYNLALLLSGGQGVPADPVRAFALTRQAAEAGLASAQNNLAILYLTGTGTPADRQKALHWMAEAARNGHPLAQRNLVALLNDGLHRTLSSASAPTAPPAR